MIIARQRLWSLLPVICGLCGCEEPTSSPSVSSKEQPVEQSDAPPPWANRTSPTGGFPCDVDAVLAASCRRCHFDPPENDAPFSLVRFEDTQAMRSGKPIFKLMEQMVEAELMPPLDEPVSPKVTPLTAQQKETLLAWLRKGAPRNEQACTDPK